jgi:hypothetical protein
MKLELLPNEIFIECFQYLNTPDLFYSFNGLNYRFHTLIRNIPLHLNFQHLKKFQVTDFCQIILSNPEIKQNIISLQLSNNGTYGQIQSFLSLISLNEFIHLRSLSLIDFNDNNDEQLLPMLPFLSNLYRFSCTSFKSRTFKIIPVLLKSKIHILSIPYFDLNPKFIYEPMLVTSLTVARGYLTELCQLFQYTPMLKYLKIELFYDDDFPIDELNLHDANAVNLEELVMNSSDASFRILELFLKQIPNLKIFSIFSTEMDYLDANRWEYFIETSLPYLHTLSILILMFLTIAILIN